MKLKERITRYVQAVPKILGFKLLTTIVLAIISSLLMLLSRALMRSTGRVSVSSGDFTFLFTTWQGYLMIAIMLVIVLLYVAVEVNALIIYISKILHGENPSVFKCIGKGIAGLKKYLNYRGIIIILYCTLISPMLGLGFSISLTSTFYIPNFITSVIFKNPFYTAGVIALVTFLIVVGIIYCFILHGALIDDMSIKEASIQSRQFLKKHWKNYILEMLRDGRITQGHARALLVIEERDLRKKIADKCALENLSVREIERLVKLDKLSKENKSKNESPEAEELKRLKILYKDLEKKMKAKLGTKVNIIPKNKDKGKLEIEYYSQDQLDRLYMILNSSSDD